LSGPIRRAFQDERAKILSLLPKAEALHTGATSVPTALTRGDLDIHVPVSLADFSGARDALARVYASTAHDVCPGFASFVAPDAPIETGVALAAIGGDHDQGFVLACDRLRRQPQLLEEHNALKLKYEDAPQGRLGVEEDQRCF
jgi:GrpB-like predicted nucleotidyltransferase (UPF0157 family)